MAIRRFSPGRRPRRFAVALNDEPGNPRIILYPVTGNSSKGQVVSIVAGRNLMYDLQLAYQHIDGGVNPTRVLKEIHKLMDGQKWDSETLDAIRDKLEAVGLQVRDYGED